MSQSQNECCPRSEKIFVGGLSAKATSDELKTALERFGKIRKISISQSPTGYAFVEFEERCAAAGAVAGIKSMGGMLISGVRVRVEFARQSHSDVSLSSRQSQQIARNDQSGSEMKGHGKSARLDKTHSLPFDSFVEVVCFLSISTLIKLNATCRKFVDAIKYHPSVRNPCRMRSLWIDIHERDRNVERGHSYTPISNANQMNQFLSNNSPNFLTGLSQRIYVDVPLMSSEYFQSVKRFFTILQRSGFGAEEHTLQIGEHYCIYFDKDTIYENQNQNSIYYFGLIRSLIKSFSHFDTVELNIITHVRYMGIHSVLNSNRLHVCFKMDKKFMPGCRKWLNYKVPNWSQPPRELCLDKGNNLRGVIALVEDLISDFCNANAKSEMTPFRFCLTFKTWYVPEEAVFAFFSARARHSRTISINISETEIRLGNRQTGESLTLTSVGWIDPYGRGHYLLRRSCLVGPLERSHFDKPYNKYIEKRIKINDYHS